MQTINGTELGRGIRALQSFLDLSGPDVKIPFRLKMHAARNLSVLRGAQEELSKEAQRYLGEHNELVEEHGTGTPKQIKATPENKEIREILVGLRERANEVVQEDMELDLHQFSVKDFEDCLPESAPGHILDLPQALLGWSTNGRAERADD